MVKLSIIGKNSIIDSESIPKSTLQILFLCSIVGNAVFARKEDKTYESKSYPSPTYRFNEEIETGFENDNRNYRGNSDRSESTWNGMKGVYGYRNSDAFRMMDYLGRNYPFNGKSLEPGASSSNPSDVVIRGKDDSQDTKGQSNSKVQIKNLIENHRLEQEVMEQKPERLTQINGDEGVDEEEEEETTEMPTTTTSTTSTTTTTTTLPPSTSSTTSTFATPTSAAPTTVSPVVPSTQTNNHHREVEGRQSISLSTSLSMTNPTPPSPSESLSTESMKQQQHKKSLNNKLSVHQLISESMPTLQMSVSPIYFYNKQTRSLVAIPYLIMKSTSKMPLLPGMMDSVGGSTGGSSNLLNYINSPLNQRLRSRPINHLSPLLEGFESRSTIDDKLSDLSYSSHQDEPETSASSRWISVQGSNIGQQSNHGFNW